MRYLSILSVSISLLLFQSLSAQEIIVPFGTTQNKLTETFKNKNRTGDTLTLPFYDDFSYKGPTPDTSLWIDDYVYINPYLAPNPPTWGMASFDALDQYGEFYPNANYETPHIADMLTSAPIDLNYPGDNSIYISFFYCAGGYADTPEAGDSLILEFLNVEEQKWEQAWYALGQSTSTPFLYAIVPVNQEQYLQKGFQFRFKNYVSLGSYLYPDLAINVDNWHIDMVYLNTGRNANDNSFRDLAVTEPLSSLTSPYSAIPYRQFIAAAQQYISPHVRVAYKNNDNTVRLIDSLQLTVSDYPNFENTQTVNAGSYNIPANTSSSINIPTGFSFADNGLDSLTLVMKARIVTADFDPERNNSITREHHFKDYFAYDDGSAEAGYGLYGGGTKFGSVAYQFHTNEPVNVTAVQMLFNRSLFDEGRDYFFLNVWNQGEDGFPEITPTLSQEGVRPEYYSTANSFHTFLLNEPVQVSDTFYIGWTQTQAKMLNVGFDLNSKSNQYLFYNISGHWQASQIEGALMMRPVVTTAENIQEPEGQLQKMTLSPNPAKYEISLNFPTEILSTITHYEIYTLSGQKITEATFTGRHINLSNFSHGIYIARAYDTKGNIYIEKFAVLR